MTHPATTKPERKFEIYYPKTGVVRGFADHDTFASYLDKIVEFGALVTWPTATRAHAVFPTVLQAAQ